MTGAACGAGNTYPSGAPDFTSSFHRGSCCPVICVSSLTIAAKSGAHARKIDRRVQVNLYRVI